ncbi:MAG: SDR family oxidoreductase [Actinobacteria bacterium]|nr:SDR family oxidoreductase [Actinomycetota bacterium]
MTDAEAPRTVVTTGANSGIGLATALEVARRGFRSVGSVRSEAKAETVSKAAADAGVEVETVIMDVTDAHACDEAIRQLRPYGIVNNAGYPVTGAVEEVTDDEARAALETMVVAPMRLARLALPSMRERGEGRIVNVSSIAGVATLPLVGWYHASKHALEALTDALRMEVAADGIKVVLIEPGGFKTGIWEEHEKDVEARAGSRYEGGYRRTLTFTRLSDPIMGDPSRVAKVIVGALSGRTRPRYLMGVDARAMAMFSRLAPAQVKDRLTRLLLDL